MSSSRDSKPASKDDKKSAVTQANIMKMAQLLEQMADGTFENDMEDAGETPKDGTEEQKPEDKTPVGMLAEIKNLYQKVDKQGRPQW